MNRVILEKQEIQNETISAINGEYTIIGKIS